MSAFYRSESAVAMRIHRQFRFSMTSFLIGNQKLKDPPRRHVPRCDERSAPSAADSWAVYPASRDCGLYLAHRVPALNPLARPGVRSPRRALRVTSLVGQLQRRGFPSRCVVLRARLPASRREKMLHQRVPCRFSVNLTAPATRQPARKQAGI